MNRGPGVRWASAQTVYTRAGSNPSAAPNSGFARFPPPTRISPNTRAFQSSPAEASDLTWPLGSPDKVEDQIQLTEGYTKKSRTTRTGPRTIRRAAHIRRLRVTRVKVRTKCVGVLRRRDSSRGL